MALFCLTEVGSIRRVGQPECLYGDSLVGFAFQGPTNHDVLITIGQRAARGCLLQIRQLLVVQITILIPVKVLMDGTHPITKAFGVNLILVLKYGLEGRVLLLLAVRHAGAGGGESDTMGGTAGGQAGRDIILEPMLSRLTYLRPQGW